MIWTKRGPYAGSRGTERTHASYIVELVAQGKELPRLFRIKSLKLEGVMIDVLHAVDQGVASRVIANVFVEVMQLRHWGTNQKTQVAGLQAPALSQGSVNVWGAKRPRLLQKFCM